MRLWWSIFLVFIFWFFISRWLIWFMIEHEFVNDQHQFLDVDIFFVLSWRCLSLCLFLLFCTTFCCAFAPSRHVSLPRSYLLRQTHRIAIVHCSSEVLSAHEIVLRVSYWWLLYMTSWKRLNLFSQVNETQVDAGSDQGKQLPNCELHSSLCHFLALHGYIAELQIAYEAQKEEDWRRLEEPKV